MGANGGGVATAKKRYISFRSRERVSLSFFIVVMFFAVFAIIIFTEIFLINEHDRGAGVVVKHGSLFRNRDRIADYEDAPIQGEDYISLHINARRIEDSVGAFLLGKPLAAAAAEPEPGPLKKISDQDLPPLPAGLRPHSGEWQSVNGTRFKFLVYSAFYDQRNGRRLIRIIGATRTRGPERVWCRFWYNSSSDNGNATHSRTVTVQAKVKIIRENWNLRYSACFIMCPLQSNETVPMTVSIVGKIKDYPTNLLRIINNYNETKPINKFGVCIKPLHFDYNRIIPLLEFIELNRLMGIEHFTFYNHTIGPEVSCVLKDYVAKGVVTLLPWQLNKSMVSQKEIRTEGLFAALNDCLYRSMYRFSHILLIDLDEFIIPRFNDTLPQLISYLNKRMNTRTTAAYSFQNAFFYLQWNDDRSIYFTNDPVATELVTMKKTRRRNKLHPHKQRSKYICRPELVVEAGNHFVWEFIPGHGTLNVPADAAILHHYRICEFGGDDCIKTPSTIDTTAFKYRKNLVNAVHQVYDTFKMKCT